MPWPWETISLSNKGEGVLQTQHSGREACGLGAGLGIERG
jgi:hypothetical protein